jgi:hypothetical protein
MKNLSFLSLFAAVFFLFSNCGKKPGVPEITKISPIYGPAETLVTIEGVNLAGIKEITFSGQIINFNRAFNADNALLMRIPKDVPLGEHDVIITTNGGSVMTHFRVTLKPPEIFKVVPESAAPGETVTIYGKNFYEPLKIYFFDSLQAQIVGYTPDSIVKVVVPVGTKKGQIRLDSNGQDTLSPVDFFLQNTIWVNDFEGNGLRSQTNKWIFVGSINQTAANAVQNTNPAPINNNFLKLSGKDNTNIKWVGGAQNNFGFPGDPFANFGITSTPDNTLLKMDINNNGKDKTYIILILLENGGSNNDFTYKIPVDWSGWKPISVPLNRFKDLNGIPVDPAKVKVLKIHLIDEEATKQQMEVNVDNIRFLEVF